MKDFVPYNLAVELKELGFDEECFGYYDSDGLQISSHHLFHGNKNSNFSEPHATNNPKISAPTYSQAFRFFRNKGISISLDSHDSNVHQFYIKWKTKDNEPKSILSEYETYEEMELECIKELINICKKYEL